LPIPSASVSSVAVIVNPISGTGHRGDAGRQRAEHAAAILSAHGLVPDVTVTERQGHARDLADALCRRGVGLVFAWGGDGTVNEVASALAFTDTALGIIPAGSGNGLATELGVPRDPAAAVAAGLSGSDRAIDAGELDGHLFFNVAGYGLDARVAHAFAAGRGRRGLARYLQSALRELAAYRPVTCIVTTEGVATETRALLVAIANTRQYGNGALVAPPARPDDGLLDLVVISHRPAWLAVAQAPFLFAGQLARVPGVRMTRITEVQIASSDPLLYHVDGEVHTAHGRMTGRVRPAALRVRAPASPR
jgi:diacylglycerol kinase (ATP)